MATGRIGAGNTAIEPTIVDAKGDIIAATAADTVSRLAVGSNDQVLTADSSTATGLKWATPSSGGLTLINTGGTTLSGAITTISSIPLTYKSLLLITRDFLPSNDDQGLRIRFNSDSNNRYGYSASVNFTTSFGEPGFNIAPGNDNSVANGLAATWIYDYANTETWKIIESVSVGVNATTTTLGNIMQLLGAYNQTSAVSSISFVVETGTITSGTAYLYGVS